MQHLSSTNLNNFIDYSSFNDGINLEEFLSNKNDNPITLTKLFALLRVWNQHVHKNFPKLISSVGITREHEDKYISWLYFRRWKKRLISMSSI